MKEKKDSLDREQVRLIAEKFGMAEEEVIETIKRLSIVMGTIWKSIRETVLNIWNGIKPFLEHVTNVERQYAHEQKVKFYRKKKSQRKN